MYISNLLKAKSFEIMILDQNFVKKSENSEFVWILEQKKVQVSLAFRHKMDQILTT